MKWLAIALAVLAAFVVALIVGPMLLGSFCLLWVHFAYNFG